MTLISELPHWINAWWFWGCDGMFQFRSEKSRRGIHAWREGLLSHVRNVSDQCLVAADNGRKVETVWLKIRLYKAWISIPYGGHAGEAFGKRFKFIYKTRKALSYYGTKYRVPDKLKSHVVYQFTCPGGGDWCVYLNNSKTTSLRTIVFYMSLSVSYILFGLI